MSKVAAYVAHLAFFEFLATGVHRFTRSFHNRSFCEQAAELNSAPIMEFTRSAFAPKTQVTAAAGTSEKRQKRSLVEDNHILVFDQIAAKRSRRRQISLTVLNFLW